MLSYICICVCDNSQRKKFENYSARNKITPREMLPRKKIREFAQFHLYPRGKVELFQGIFTRIDRCSFQNAFENVSFYEDSIDQFSGIIFFEEISFGEYTRPIPRLLQSCLGLSGLFAHTEPQMRQNKSGQIYRREEEKHGHWVDLQMYWRAIQMCLNLRKLHRL